MRWQPSSARGCAWSPGSQSCALSASSSSSRASAARRTPWRPLSRERIWTPRLPLCNQLPPSGPRRRGLQMRASCGRPRHLWRAIAARPSAWSATATAWWNSPATCRRLGAAQPPRSRGTARCRTSHRTAGCCAVSMSPTWRHIPRPADGQRTAPFPVQWRRLGAGRRAGGGGARSPGGASTWSRTRTRSKPCSIWTWPWCSFGTRPSGSSSTAVRSTGRRPGERGGQAAALASSRSCSRRTPAAFSAGSPCRSGSRHPLVHPLGPVHSIAVDTRLRPWGLILPSLFDA
mmetsp:Transcript_53742/g.149080  ORF Transcript_53742/g.149080 Transcript_53742/m.149080 type:complete len:289 (-) Transcript_53742:61-927(-)